MLLTDVAEFVSIFALAVIGSRSIYTLRHEPATPAGVIITFVDVCNNSNRVSIDIDIRIGINIGISIGIDIRTGISVSIGISIGVSITNVYNNGSRGGDRGGGRGSIDNTN